MSKHGAATNNSNPNFTNSNTNPSKKGINPMAKNIPQEFISKLGQFWHALLRLQMDYCDETIQVVLYRQLWYPIVRLLWLISYALTFFQCYIPFKLGPTEWCMIEIRKKDAVDAISEISSYHPKLLHFNTSPVTWIMWVLIHYSISSTLIFLYILRLPTQVCASFSLRFYSHSSCLSTSTTINITQPFSSSVDYA